MSKTAVHYPLFKKEDTDAFFALFQNNLANFVIISVTMLGMGFPTDIVFGKVVPGAAVAVLAGNLYYAHMAKKLAIRENRTDVTALSYGISTPPMFVFLFGVMAPALALTDSHEMAWKIAVAACFISGIVEALMGFIGRWIHQNIPRAAMLGALAGLALTFIAGEMMFNTLQIPVIGLVVLAIVVVGIIGKMAMPFKIPASLFAIIVGTVLAYLFGYAKLDSISSGLSEFGFYPILPTLATFEGFGLLFGTAATIFAVVLPITIYNAIETMNNVEAVGALGDKYDIKESMIVDGIGTMIGPIFGGAFPTTVYMASTGSKWMGAGRGYSILNGIVYIFAAVFGLVAVISSLIPISAIAPIMVFIGISMIATAYQTSHSKYFPAIAIAMIPYFSNYVMTRFNNDAGEVVSGISPAIVPLGQGALITAIILGAIVVYIIDGNYIRASLFSFAGMLLSFFGIIHAPAIAFNASPEYAIGYLVIGLYFLIISYTKKADVKKDQQDEELLEEKVT
ncbi:SulP family inorganic anion transporter [Ornithinibacillus halophilus]|uniref:Putative MFS transporter, AGZA family, xanthine/uracil permease n=1 Tax=Ornithinibacillus halophilus TaxID=930117 RepID=A0A1M5FNJ3_9BACI|nr:uracil permease [Ornithinibacillus halophilus]SHF93100.1 putative MFS transporter, AGZA family, xanthine/uracil permease [Ornithinibacillus halophilus]